MTDDLHHLATWAGGASDAVADLLDRGEVEAAYLYQTLGNVGLRVSFRVEDLDDALRDTAAKAAAWEAGRGNPFEGARYWLRQMAGFMRQAWAMETRRRFDAMLPLLPDEPTRALMMEERLETPEVALFHWRDSVIEHLAGTIALFEAAAAGVDRADTEQVHRQIDPHHAAEMDRRTRR